MRGLLDFTGIEQDRLHFSWVSSAEASKFITVVKDVTQAVKALGPAKNFVKTQTKVD